MKELGDSISPLGMSYHNLSRMENMFERNYKMRTSLSCEEISFRQINALEIAMELLADNTFPKAWLTLGLFESLESCRKTQKTKGSNSESLSFGSF